MNVVNFAVKGEPESIEILPIADLHIGDKNSDWKLIVSKIDYVKSTPNAYVLLLGDLLDCATKSSVGDIYSASMNVNEGLNTLAALLGPISDKIISIIGGNHEARVYRMEGLDVTEQLAHRLGIIERYSAETVVVQLTVNKVTYKLYCSHGSGSGRKIGSKANRLLELSDIVEGCDAYIQAHTHCPIVTRKTRLEATKNGKLIPREMLFVNCASALKYGGYGEIQGFSPTSMVNPTINLNGNARFAWAAL